ncbi:MAG TPA: fumarylacetoacetate hydrolase family protein [Pseudonocardiaceae bacterium]|nr:fumarylacetoacetate hydrolase family protein [Pseudonocardiaceae bacterium]
MRIARIGVRGQETPAVWDGSAWRDLSTVTPDVNPAFIARGVGGISVTDLPVLNDVMRFGVPLAGVGKIPCIGLNYRDHAAETGAPEPAEPILFFKTPDTLNGPDDDVFIPRGSVKTDWEVELGVVIGTETHYLESPDQSLAHVAGYVVSNDVSERAYQLDRGGQWDKGKNCDTFNPMGPWFVTADEIGDPQNLGLRLWVNGQLKQNGNTANMIFGVAHLVWYLSQFLVLRPGDVINTGTPAGVAMGAPDQPFLRDGDLVELEIDGLGRMSQHFYQI